MNGEITKDSFMSTLREVMKHLNMVIQVWGQYRTKSEEKKESEVAHKLAVKINQDHLHQNIFTNM